ncbi:hypothetical protein LBMAG38_11110 [Chloroflexota bacterium]|nr:hypothetical protein LBMAG38_11110 [Chloroflexota bacterium]
MKRLVVGAIAVVMALGVIGAIRITAVNEGVSILDVIDPAGAPETTGATNPTPQPRFPVRIRIRDASGAPVADATVEIRDRFGGLILDIQPTDARGELRFTAPPTTGVVIRARKAQVGQVVSEPITLGPPGAGQSARDIDLSLSATATIPGTAAVPTIAPVAGTRPIASPTPSVQRTPMAGPATALVQTPTRGPATMARLFVGHLQPRISAIDLASGTVLNPSSPPTLGGGRFTYLAGALASRRLFASWGGSNELVTIRADDMSIETRTPLNAGAVSAVAVGPADGHVWVATAGAEGQEYSNVIELDARGSKVIRRLNFPRRTGTLRFTSQGTVLAVSHRTTSEVSLVDVATGMIRPPIRTPVWPGETQLSDDGQTLYLGNQSTTTVYALDASNGETRKIIDVGNGVNGFVLHPDGVRLLVVNGQLGLIQVVNRETSEVQAVIPVGQQPQAIVLGGDGQRAYVANSGSGTVSVIDLGTMAVTDTINVGAGAATLALVP